MTWTLNGTPLGVGTHVFVMTQKYYYVGHVAAVAADADGRLEGFWLTNTTLVWDTGRLHVFLERGTASKLERQANDVLIQTQQIMALFPWPHATVGELAP